MDGIPAINCGLLILVLGIRVRKACRNLQVFFAIKQLQPYLMKRFIFLLSIALFSCQQKDIHDPAAYLTVSEKDKLIGSVVRYISKPPKGVDNKAKFNASFDEYYLEKTSELRLERLYKKDDTYYFLITQPAPSVVEKRNATGGKLTVDQNGNLRYYEEVFRTWKMSRDTLQKRSSFLFHKMVEDEALNNYYPAITGDQYIEFPDSRTFFDVQDRQWETK
jgi:hypothetical protein